MATIQELLKQYSDNLFCRCAACVSMRRDIEKELVDRENTASEKLSKAKVELCHTVAEVDRLKAVLAEKTDTLDACSEDNTNLREEIRRGRIERERAINEHDYKIQLLNERFIELVNRLEKYFGQSQLAGNGPFTNDSISKEALKRSAVRDWKKPL